VIPVAADALIHHEPLKAVLSFPPASEDPWRLDSGYLDGNREYDPGFLETAWDEVDEALAVERDRLAITSAATSWSEFEALLDGDLDDWEQIALCGLDAGVAAPVLALAAAGCVTTTSCRGHAGYVGPHLDYPRVASSQSCHARGSFARRRSTLTAALLARVPSKCGVNRSRRLSTSLRGYSISRRIPGRTDVATGEMRVVVVRAWVSVDFAGDGLHDPITRSAR